jgi:hypothetical protein
MTARTKGCNKDRGSNTFKRRKASDQSLACQTVAWANGQLRPADHNHQLFQRITTQVAMDMATNTNATQRPMASA